MNTRVFVVNAAYTASGNTSSFEVFDKDKMAITLKVDSASGTSPTLDVVVEDSADGTNWNTLSSFAQKTAAGTETLRITNPFHRYVRVKYTVGGTTPSFTFDVKATLR